MLASSVDRGSPAGRQGTTRAPALFANRKTCSPVSNLPVSFALTHTTGRQTTSPAVHPVSFPRPRGEAPAGKSYGLPIPPTATAQAPARPTLPAAVSAPLVKCTPTRWWATHHIPHEESDATASHGERPSPHHVTHVVRIFGTSSVSVSPLPVKAISARFALSSAHQRIWGCLPPFRPPSA
jgi:hypothetical protein